MQIDFIGLEDTQRHVDLLLSSKHFAKAGQMSFFEKVSNFSLGNIFSLIILILIAY